MHSIGIQQKPKSRKKSGGRYRTVDLPRADFMGIDWGMHDVGVSLAEGETRIAYGYKKISNDANLLENLGSIIAEKGVQTVVIGIPSAINRVEVVYEGEVLGEELKKRFGVHVEYQNEMFTTKIAHRQLIERGIRNIERYDDQEAARIILESWLEKV